MRIVFMGTPDFAVASLSKLIEAGEDVVGVVTAPDKPAGRGRKLRYSPVKEYALEKGLPVFQPSNLKAPEWLATLKDLKPDLQVVVAFRMLPESVWSLPPLGTINLHASLLPQYRGAAPINWAIINGEKETGVTTFFINENIDTGAIIDSARVTIEPDDSAGSLHDKLMKTGADLLAKTVRQIADGKAPRQEQTMSNELKHAPKIFKEDTQIDFSQPVKKVYDFIRGLSPYPAATCTLYMEDKKYPLKIFSATIMAEGESDLVPGNLQTDNKKYMNVECQNGVISVESLQIAGKKRMSIAEFLNGFKLDSTAKLA